MSISIDTRKAYNELLVRAKNMAVIRSTALLVNWDSETYMPPRGIGIRSEQMALLDLIVHRELLDRKFAKLLLTVEFDKNLETLSFAERRNLQLLRRAYDESAKLPEKLVTELARQQTLSVGSWKRAKAAKDYSIFKPDLSKNIELKKELAGILMAVKGTKTDYDALVDSFEPGLTSDIISEVFSNMKRGLISIMKKIERSGTKPDLSILHRPVTIAAQKRISKALMDYIRFETSGENSGGRLDESEHPFTNGYYEDVRITTHYYPERFTTSMFSVLHEGGHALYEQNIPIDWIYQPIGSSSSYGVHESQSRFVENIIGRSPEYLSHFLPKMRRLTGKVLTGVKLSDFILAVNNVEPSKIRTEADEVTYGLHVIIRFEIEKDIFAGKVDVNELPQIWNEKYSKYLGIDVENDSEGLMQDIHWSSGMFGYFPSYALGNIYGGMFLSKMNKDLPTWKTSIRAGDFAPVKDWFVTNIHTKGDLYDPVALVKIVTGNDLSIEPFIEYLNKKFGGIYGF
jgi:carboxypeptidase Taq